MWYNESRINWSLLPSKYHELQFSSNSLINRLSVFRNFINFFYASSWPLLLQFISTLIHLHSFFAYIIINFFFFKDRNDRWDFVRKLNRDILEAFEEIDLVSYMVWSLKKILSFLIWETSICFFFLSLRYRNIPKNFYFYLMLANMYVNTHTQIRQV